MSYFCAADILIPKDADLQKWAVIACDQFTSEPEYWQRVEQFVADAPSTLRMIHPEAWIGNSEKSIESVNRTMEEYLSSGIFQILKNSYIYVERTIEGGRIRRGLLGMVDLEAYDWRPGSVSPIRATEGTVPERLPPRVLIRQNAPLELPHILMLANDPADQILAPLSAWKANHEKLYSVDLMEQGGHLNGWQISGEAAEALNRRITAYESGTTLPYAVGDGNHSLAAAKACWEQIRETAGENHPARYALVELENIHDPALLFEPIHRVVKNTDPQKLLNALQEWCAPIGTPVKWITAQGEGEIFLDPARGTMAVGVLQAFLNQYDDGEIDYIHGSDTLMNLSRQPDSIGFLLPDVDKAQLFESVAKDGALPRKTFSMGHANEKRYYLEGRTIR